MIITCPNCQSRYEVAQQALGDRGRKVECAQCHANWKALPLAEPDSEDALFTEEQEAELDAAFAQEEAGGNGELPDAEADGPGDESMTGDRVPDPQRLAWQRRALERRQQVLKREMPRARRQRAFRMAMAIALMTLVGGAWQLREPLVRAFPELGGLYAALGVEVNVVGLEFAGTRTLRTTRGGVPSLEVTADLINVAGRQVGVPPILVALVDETGASQFEWSVTPQSRAIPAGGGFEFVTQLSAPPAEATHVRLSFIEWPVRRAEQE